MKQLCHAGFRQCCLGVAALLVCGLFANSANAWWDTNWGSRITITFNNSAQTGGLVNFPVLVVLDNSRIDYGKTQNAGQDLRFVDADDLTPLAYEIETWDESGLSYVWVQVPNIPAGSSGDFIYMYYDHTTAPDAQNPPAVWSNGYAGVWHLAENPAGGNPILDSTANGKNGVASASMNAGNLVTSQIGDGLEFDGTSDFVRVASNATDALAITGSFITLEALVRHNGSTSGNNWEIPFGRQLGLSSVDSYLLAIHFNTPTQPHFITTAGGNANGASGQLPNQTWTYLAGVQNAANLRLYVNGAQVRQLASGGVIQTDNNDVTFGGMENGAGSTISEWFVGRLDELRISNVQRNRSWIAAQQLSMMTQTFNTYGAPESPALPTITLSKSADVATAKPGDTITYTLTYGNSGAGDATNLVITDTMPANTTLVPASITGGGTESGGVITWNLGPLAAGQINRTVDFAVTVDAGVLAGVVIDNDATANFDDSGGAPQTPVTSNTLNITVDQMGGVLVQFDQFKPVKSSTGTQVSYPFTVTNTGNGNDEFDLSLQKSGPSFFPAELLDATGTVLMAQDTDADGTWDFINPAFDFDADGLPDTGTMAAAATLDVILRLTVPPGTSSGSQEITSLIATSHFGPVDDRATATTTAISNANGPDITFTKIDSPDPVIANEMVNYTLTYNNIGGAQAKDVVIVDSVPAGSSFVSGTAFGETGVTIEFSTNNGSTWGAEPADPTTVTDIRWTVGKLPKNSGVQTAGFTVQPDIALPDGTVLDNEATFSSQGLLVTTATASTTVRAAVAFTDSTKSVTPTLAPPGTTLTYTIYVIDSGVLSATNVVVTDLLPLETTYVPGSITGPGADDSGAPTLVWNLGAVAAGATIGPLTYEVVVDNPVAAGTFFIENTATIDSTESMPANTTKATTVLTGAPLFTGSSKTAQDLNAGALLVGDTIEYRVDVINTGDMHASGVVVTDTVPADTTYVPGSITGLGADDSAAPNLSWNIGNLAVGVPSVVTFRATVNGGVPAGTQISNSAQIASNQTVSISTPPVFNTVGGGMTGFIQSTTPIVPGASVLIQITDADLNTDIATPQSLSETTTNTVTGETELLVYTETGPNTGVFEATVLTVFGVVAGTNDDGVFNVQAGDALETTYNDAQTSTGAPGTATATTVVTSGGVTGTLVSTTPINAGDTVIITLTDADLNVDPDAAETTSVTTVNSVTGESETLVYTETGVNTGVFSASVATVFGIVAGTDDDGTFNVQAGDTLNSIYNDAVTASGGPGVAVATTDVVSAGVSGTISSTPTIFPFDAVNFTLSDADLDTDPGVAETIVLTTTNTVTGESEALVYTETGVNTGVFTATVATVFGTVAGTNDDGSFNVQGGDSLTTTYNDAISGTGGPATDIATTNVVAGSPAVLVTKTVSTDEDPYNGTTNPKAVPGATMLYTIGLTNSGNGLADADSVVITEPVPANTALRVIDFDGSNAGPVAFVDGTPASGLTYTFVALGDPGDDVEFSNNGGSSYIYTPVADANGVDTTVTHMRIKPKGNFLFSPSGDPNFEVMLKHIVQ